MPLLYHAYVYLEFLILACTIYILAPERLNMAIEVGSWLESMNVEPVLWNEPEVFPLGVYKWDALIDLSKNVDAAVFIFGEDDKIWFRGEGVVDFLN